MGLDGLVKVGWVQAAAEQGASDVSGGTHRCRRRSIPCAAQNNMTIGMGIMQHFFDHSHHPPLPMHTALPASLLVHRKDLLGTWTLAPRCGVLCKRGAPRGGIHRQYLRWDWQRLGCDRPSGS